MKKKLAIIGASIGQLPLCEKAKEMGLEVHCFAYQKGAVCKDVADFFYPISIYEMDQIVERCKEIGIDGVVSNASDLTAEVVAYVAEKLQLVGASYKNLIRLKNKYFVRTLTRQIPGLSSLIYYKYNGKDEAVYPCVVKPCIGSSKSGVSFVLDSSDFGSAIEYAMTDSHQEILVEEYIEGRELSVECISYKGEHDIIQITDKDSSGAPHFVELGHHQPACISNDLRDRIYRVIPAVLMAIGYENGASHIEVKYRDNELFLVEINLRGGGDMISNKLVYLSSGIDYLRCMIEVALNQYSHPLQVAPSAYAGVYFLCKQTAYLLPFFDQEEQWMVDKHIDSYDLQESSSNYERNGYLIYQWNKKINLT